MGIKIADRILETSSGTGTGTLNFAGAVPNFAPHSSFLAHGDQMPYSIAHTTLSQWETGIGTFLSGPNRLQRDTVLSSSNSNAHVNFSPGDKNIMVDVPAAYTALTKLTAPATGHVLRIDENGLVVNLPTPVVVALLLLQETFRIRSPLIDFTASNVTYPLLTVPDGHVFMVDGYEIITTQLTSLSGDAEVEFGVSTNHSAFYGPTSIVTPSQYFREFIQAPSNALVAGSILTGSVGNPSTATLHKGYFVVSGYLMAV